VGATYASAAAYNWTEWATAYAVFSPGLGPLLAGLAEADVEDNPNFAAAGSRDTATPASYAVGPDFTSRMYGSLLVQCPVYATLVDDQGRRTGWKPNAGPNEFPFLAEIPDARFWEGSEANGSAGWMLALPRTRVTAILTAYGTGTANIMFGSGEKTPFVFQDVPVSAGDTATVVLDRSDPNPPVLRFASGRTVQATLLGPNACVPAGGSQFTVTRGGYRYNNTTKRYTQVVTFKNNASQALSGRLSLVLANLSANASLVDQSGLTNCAAPANSVYIDIPLPSGLPAGGTASASLDFINPTNQAITYEPRVYAGVGNR
jgi:hypothetical protein